MYEIRQENDMLAGASLVVVIEESELDKKALYTIQETKPGFILPINTMYIDGKIEFTYQIKTLSKLQYITGDCTIEEYVQLWRSVLQPLLECDDWFMKIQSFVLDTEHLYYDKEKKSISYVYIPTKLNCSEYGDLKKMASELVKQISVTDIALENKALRMIMNGFKPKEFLDMLNEYVPEKEKTVSQLQGKSSISELSPIEHSSVKTQPISSPLKELWTNTFAYDDVLPAQADNAFEDKNNRPVDITINMQTDGKEGKKEKKKSSKKSEKRKKREQISIFGKEKAEKEIKADNAEKQRDDSMNSKIKYKDLPEDAMPNLVCNTQPMLENEPYDDATQCISTIDSACMLRLVGSPLLPSSISIQIEDGEVFTIGRYDATVGRKQSSFEFERKTKAISRRHAVIKRQMGSYSLIDLSSGAGTFVNGQKLPPNTPFELESGTRISFGTSGADYVFES